MDKANFTIIVLAVLDIVINITWFVTLMRTNDRWCDRLIDFSMRCLKTYKEETDEN